MTIRVCAGLMLCAMTFAGARASASLPPVQIGGTIPGVAQLSLNPSGGTFSYPAADGYAATLVYGSSNAPAGTIAKLQTIPNFALSLLPAQAPPGMVRMAYELTLTSDVTFAKWNGLLSSVSIPSSLTAGTSFADYAYDLSAAVALGFDPGTVSGATVSFPAGRPSTTLLARHTYLMRLT